MKLTITDKLVKKLKITSKYRLKISYYGDEKSIYDSIDENEIIQILTLISEYKKRADKSWNDWCNVETDMIMDVINDLNLDISEDSIYDFWADSSEYDFLALPQSYKVTYFNSNGIEVIVNIEEN